MCAKILESCAILGGRITGPKRRVALALDLEIAVPHHHGVFAGTQRYAAAQPRWECVIDEHPFHRQLSRIKPFQNYDAPGKWS